MATGSALPNRQREADHRDDDRGRRFAPGLTPVSLFLVLLLFWVLTQMGLVLVLGLLALLLGTVLEGPVSRLEQRRFPRAAAIATVYVVLIGIVSALVFLIVPVVRSEADRLQEQLPAQLAGLESEWRESSNPILSGSGADFLQTVVDFVESPGEGVDAPEGAADEALPVVDAAERALPVVTTIAGALVSFLTLLVITFYYLLEKRLLRRLLLDQLSPSFRPRVDRLWTEVESKVGGWMRGQLLLCLIIGTIATVSYGIVGLSFWPLLGLWAGLTEIIPIVGPWIGGIPAVLVALTEGWQTAVIVGFIILGMQTLENWFLVPRVMRGAVGLTPLTVFVAILAGTQLMNVVGAVLAIPIAATIQVLLTDYLDQRKLRRASEAMPVSSWRWMLNRGIGREPSATEPAEPPEDPVADNEQVVSEQVYPGVERPREGRKDESSSAEATWPATPWRPRGGTSPAPGTTWRGMSRPASGEKAGKPAPSRDDDEPGTTNNT